MSESYFLVININSSCLVHRGVYSLNFMEKKPEPGSYRFSVSAAPTPADTKLVGATGSSLSVKVMCWLTLVDASIGTLDTERTTKPKLET
jgi:Oligosaccharyltransferase subunit Ribophorin II.